MKKNVKTGIFLLFISILFVQTPLFSQSTPEVMAKPVLDSSKDIIIHQEADFTAAPQLVYQTLLSSKKFSACTKLSFSAFSATSANIDSAVGGTFSLFDGHIIGRILELVPNQRIVEAWRVVDWPPGVYSIARFDLKPQGSGTHLVFEHIGFPAGLKDHLSAGWQQHYWEALNRYFQ
jgi:activator of HSP90 ATPase